jgi:hypothetical protein
LDFSVISPAINEVARIEGLCEPLDEAVLVSAKFVAGMMAADIGSSRSLPRFVRLKEPKEVFVMDFGRLEYTDRHQKRVAPLRMQSRKQPRGFHSNRIQRFRG